MPALAETPRPGPPRATGLQVAVSALAAELRAWREHFAPAEYAVLVEIAERFVADERRRVEYREGRRRLRLVGRP
jgi:hypothetical protein